MPNFASLTTFSGLVVCLATMLVLYKQFAVGGLLFIMDGVGGTAIVWDRWSQRAGHEVHLTALASPVHLTGSETAMLVTHLPLAVIGIVVLIAVDRVKRHRAFSNSGHA